MMSVSNENISKYASRKRIKQSMSRKGNCLDNSCAENFFWNIKIRIILSKRKRI